MRENAPPLSQGGAAESTSGAQKEKVTRRIVTQPAPSALPAVLPCEDAARWYAPLPRDPIFVHQRARLVDHREAIENLGAGALIEAQISGPQVAVHVVKGHSLRRIPATE